MDACEIANFLASELFMHQFVNDGGYNSGMSGISGVPTRTTSTLTPTTLRNIEQTFQDLTNDLSQSSSPYSAGFVPPSAPINQNQLTVLTNNTLPPYQPPMRQQQQQQQQHHQLLPTFLNDVDPNSMESMDSSSMSDTGSYQTPPPTVDDVINGSSKGRPRSSYASPGSSSSNSNPKPARRNAGGRKPNKSSNLSPEEEEKRRVRRERNKQAAARCRRRREDHTQILQDEVDNMETKKRQLTAEVQEMSRLRDELCELIEEHKKLNRCVIGDRQSPPDIKPVVNGKIASVPATVATTIVHVPLQRPTNFVSNNNNNNTMNANKLALKIKAEPLDEFYDEDEPPRKRKCDMLSGQEFDITTPTTPYMPQLNTPTFIKNQRPRPSSLNVPANLKPSDFLARKGVAEAAGVTINTPSTGMFNFDSLMEGGTGLTPINPLIPCSTQNRNPMEMLQTPTSEPSKLVSL